MLCDANNLSLNQLSRYAPFRDSFDFRSVTMREFQCGAVSLFVAGIAEVVPSLGPFQPERTSAQLRARRA